MPFVVIRRNYDSIYTLQRSVVTLFIVHRAGCWVQVPGIGQQGGALYSAVTSLTDCLATCANISCCIGIDWTVWTNSRCWVILLHDAAYISYSSTSEVTHYSIQRPCSGKKAQLCIVKRAFEKPFAKTRHFD